MRIIFTSLTKNTRAGPVWNFDLLRRVFDNDMFALTYNRHISYSTRYINPTYHDWWENVQLFTRDQVSRLESIRARLELIPECEPPVSRVEGGNGRRTNEVQVRHGPLITPRQERILFALANWEREADDSEFALIEISAGTFFDGHRDFPVTRSDVEQLGAKGYVHLRAAGDELIAAVTAEGYAYYDSHQGSQHPAEVLAVQLREYVDTRAEQFYPDSAKLLGKAADRLWAARGDAEVNEVGFKVREALQTFAQAYYRRFYPRASDEPVPAEKTLDAVSGVIRYMQRERGATDTAFADALFAYWRGLLGLDQKVVHGSQDVQRPLRWQDGQRVLLHAYLVIADLHAFATGDRIG
jgi:hypothetical protein